MVISYDYDNEEPRLFSKQFLRDRNEYRNVSIGDAVGASAAAPGYFDPKLVTNKIGFTEALIDGGVIANSPAFYAFQLANIKLK